ncbi:MAG: hypothetical protein E7163_03045 [Firmicutes bacterium]|nr:hypothetical protein [Bacillota bacterium]
MKDSINFYYNFNISEVEYWGNTYRFLLNNSYSYFVPLKRTNEELEDIVNISKELKARGLEVHDILLNKFGKIVTNVYNENYILLKPLNDIYEEYDISDIINLNKKLILSPNKSKLYRNSWSRLWSEKIDFFEYQIHELGKDKKIILNSFSYYIGLAENAISYVNSTINNYKPNDNDKICLSHRRINYPNYKLNFLNPISFIFDLEIRDIAEYIKSSFFYGDDALNNLRLALKLNNFSVYSLQLLYARLLYPCYYFDLYEKIINEEESEECLIPVIEKNKEYEKFLKNAYYEISKYASIERVEWLLK